VGAILVTGKQTVSAVLWVMELSQNQNYATYHPVLSWVVWSGLAVSAILLHLLIQTFDPGRPPAQVWRFLPKYRRDWSRKAAYRRHR
jgi:hypothetical protein